jgi:hypothetical protein
VPWFPQWLINEPLKLAAGALISIGLAIAIIKGAAAIINENERQRSSRRRSGSNLQRRR